MANDPSFGELYKGKAIIKADIAAAVDAYMADQDAERLPVGDGYAVDMGAAIDASPFARGMLADPEIKDVSKRAAVRTAILLARPVKG